MDTITKIIAGPATVWTTVVCLVGLVSIGLGVYWFFNKQAVLRELAELRKKLDELEPSDPEYGDVRALYTSMAIDADRWGFFHADSGSGTDGGSIGHGGGDHGGDGGSGGGDH
jgi:uncharacterized membrane protein YgcG